MEFAQKFEWIGRQMASLSVCCKWLVITQSVVLTFIGRFGVSNLRSSGDYQIFFGGENPELQVFLEFESAHGKADRTSFAVTPDLGGIYEPDVMLAVHELTNCAGNLSLVSWFDVSVIFGGPFDSKGQKMIPLNLFENDAFLGGHITWNEVQESKLLVGAVIDVETSALYGSVEYERCI